MAAVMKLDGDKLTKLQSVEKEMGYCLVAFEPVHKPADLSDAQLQKLRSLEKDLDAVIVAYDYKA